MHDLLIEIAVSWPIHHRTTNTFRYYSRIPLIYRVNSKDYLKIDLVTASNITAPPKTHATSTKRILFGSVGNLMERNTWIRIRFIQQELANLFC